MSASELERLVGLTAAKRSVRQIIEQSSGMHALMLFGPEGSGKSELARILIRSWLCPSTVDGWACGECGVCRSFGANRCVDHLLIHPTGPSRLIPQRYIVPTQDREADQPAPLTDFVRTRPLMARHKTVLIQDADRLVQTAAHALLKPLEEPEPHVRFVLTTTMIGKVPPTIKARCMVVACELPPAGVIRASYPELTEGGIAFAQGSPGRAQLILEDAERRLALWDTLERLQTAELAEGLAIAESLRTWGESHAELNDCPIRASNAEVLRALSSWLRLRLPREPELWELAAEAHRRIEGNANAAVVFDALVCTVLCQRTATPGEPSVVGGA